MAAVERPRARAGRTAKISVSIDRGDLSMLKKRAKRLHAGNLSAVIADGVRMVREQEGREALVEWLGTAGRTTSAQRDAIRSEWRGTPPSPRRTA